MSNTKDDFIESLRQARNLNTLNIPSETSVLIPRGVEATRGGPKYHFITLNAVIQLKESIKRTIDPPSTFDVNGLKEITISTYLAEFLYFETCTIHLLALIDSTNLKQYFRLQEVYSCIQLSDRVELLKAVSSQWKINNISKIKSLSGVRNQVAHNLNPVLIKYNDGHKPRQYDDPDLVNAIIDDSNAAMYAISCLYSKYLPKLFGWLEISVTKLPDSSQYVVGWNRSR